MFFIYLVMLVIDELQIFVQTMLVIDELQVEENFKRSSDNEDALKNENIVKKYYLGDIEIIGFHPHKEIIFLSDSVETGYAYHLKSSKIQVLGNLHPTRYRSIVLPNEHNESFPYTPCWMRGFPEKN